MYLNRINPIRINLNQEIRKCNIKENARLRITPKMKCNKTQYTEICRPPQSIQKRTATTRTTPPKTMKQPRQSHQAADHPNRATEQPGGKSNRPRNHPRTVKSMDKGNRPRNHPRADKIN